MLYKVRRQGKHITSSFTYLGLYVNHNHLNLYIASAQKRTPPKYFLNKKF
jgi:hypothetical protein